MAKKLAIEVTKCGGLKCDNPNCDYEDMNIKIEDYKNWVEKPCPKCGWVLLTKKDYKVSMWLHRIIRFLNFILPKRDENDTENLSIRSVKFKGNEDPRITIEKYKILHKQVKNKTGEEPIVIGSKEYIEEIKKGDR